VYQSIRKRQDKAAQDYILVLLLPLVRDDELDKTLWLALEDVGVKVAKYRMTEAPEPGNDPIVHIHEATLALLAGSVYQSP
jgi:hypothetical protein